uniref:Uncharacterized protein n=1 Tax=Compsopogon caeruleus TaxID=31354 RepID=A0A7S1TGA4_9RHOD|mmetsp:Transcript_4875/g.9856  ORF Transcript_4875/g.9856 Transcript_4875/m.9856 type:complete len:204 (+) Transcript_4875:20-631(+)
MSVRRWGLSSKDVSRLLSLLQPGWSRAISLVDDLNIWVEVSSAVEDSPVVQATGTLSVSDDSMPELRGHFPGRAVVPAVTLFEAWGQACVIATHVCSTCKGLSFGGDSRTQTTSPPPPSYHWARIQQARFRHVLTYSTPTQLHLSLHPPDHHEDVTTLLRWDAQALLLPSHDTDAIRLAASAIFELTTPSTSATIEIPFSIST